MLFGLRALSAALPSGAWCRLLLVARLALATGESTVSLRLFASPPGGEYSFFSSSFGGSPGLLLQVNFLYDG